MHEAGRAQRDAQAARRAERARQRHLLGRQATRLVALAELREDERRAGAPWRDGRVRRAPFQLAASRGQKAVQAALQLTAPHVQARARVDRVAVGQVVGGLLDEEGVGERHERRVDGATVKRGVDQRSQRRRQKPLRAVHLAGEVQRRARVGLRVRQAAATVVDERAQARRRREGHAGATRAGVLQHAAVQALGVLVALGEHQPDRRAHEGVAAGHRIGGKVAAGQGAGREVGHVIAMLAFRKRVKAHARRA